MTSFNERTIRPYQRVGFVETGRHVETIDGRDPLEFVDMEIDA